MTSVAQNNYATEMYRAWKSDPTSVHSSWANLFQSGTAPTPSPQAQTPISSESINSSITVGVMAQKILRAYRKYGHFHAKLDPLGLKERTLRKELMISRFGVTDDDFKKVLTINDILTSQVPGSEVTLEEGYTLGNLIENLEASYCGNIGAEYMHIQDRVQCNWLRTRLEKHIFTVSTEDNFYTPSKEDRINCLDRLIWATSFEEFLQIKFQDKRFGCDGAEVIIPGMKTLIDSAADFGIEDVMIGMAHRGRLNMLANVVRKPIPAIFYEFKAGTAIGDERTGDVKYHLGVSCVRPTRSEKRVYLSLVPNPSHLEAVDPVVEGMTAARQYSKNDTTQSKVMSVLIHGDGSIAGQGVVYETITMSGLPKYTTGGTIHVIINNQISFTTDPIDECPSEYCTDVALTNGAPVFHVNGDDPDAVSFIFRLAAEWRQTFNKDIVIDIVCYRRFGHNEVDQPAFTQPLMYQRIAKHPKTVDIYAKKLMANGLLTQNEYDQMRKSVREKLEEYFTESLNYDNEKLKGDEVFNSHFEKKGSTKFFQPTGISDETFDAVAQALVTIPEDFTMHPILLKQLVKQKKSFDTGEALDWATAEAMAFGSLLIDGYEVRLSGQDAERGTFGHRNAVLHDQKNENEYTPLAHIRGATQSFQVKNSFLSEYAALGYELGYSLESPNALVIWEAQFGDFANGAQIIIDQFVTSCEQKWGRFTPLVMLLPHGMDGMGPEHSSCRLERFLQMSDQDDRTFVPEFTPDSIRDTNLIVVNCTTPANFFHALRRQIYSDWKKPLIVASPKLLLRHPEVKSSKQDFAPGTHMIRVIPETSNDLVADDKIERVLFCSGKVYYDLTTERKSKDIKNIALVRIEQLAPFPFDLVAKEIQKYPNAEITWCQEEHMNHGAWTYMFFNFQTTLKHIGRSQTNPNYIGRVTSASPATGSSKQHAKEQALLMQQAFDLKRGEN